MKTTKSEYLKGEHEIIIIIGHSLLILFYISLLKSKFYFYKKRSLLNANEKRVSNQRDIWSNFRTLSTKLEPTQRILNEVEAKWKWDPLL